jgi:LacI family transcriptional regulator
MSRRARATARQTRRVALLINSYAPYDVEAQRGIFDYANHAGTWEFLSEVHGDITRRNPQTYADPVHQVDGIIWSSLAPAAPQLRAGAIPTVGVCGNSLEIPPARVFAQVIPDHRLAGQHVARHMVERGFRSFAFCGVSARFSQERAVGFQEVVESVKGSVCSIYVPARQDWGNLENDWEADGIADWIASLPKPVAIMAATDVRARHVLISCKRRGFLMPEDVALASVDNDPVICEMLKPQITSLPLDARKAGFTAAAILDELMGGKPPPAYPVKIAPLAIVSRHSSDILAIEDREVAEAVRFIRDRADKAVSVEEVLKTVAISRRALERRFRAVLGRTPQEEIWLTHIKHAKKLLNETHWPMPRVARASGFPGAVRFSIVFRRLTGQTPSRYRREYHRR